MVYVALTEHQGSCQRAHSRRSVQSMVYVAYTELYQISPLRFSAVGDRLGATSSGRQFLRRSSFESDRSLKTYPRTN
jgi:hypothetical protein